MSARRKIYSVRPNNKLLSYMRTMGWIDGRNGTIKKEAPEFSKFACDCIIYVLEQEITKYSTIANSAELRLGYLRHMMDELGKENRDVIEKMQSVRDEINRVEDELLLSQRENALKQQEK